MQFTSGSKRYGMGIRWYLFPGTRGDQLSNRDARRSEVTEYQDDREKPIGMMGHARLSQRVFFLSVTDRQCNEFLISIRSE